MIRENSAIVFTEFQDQIFQKNPQVFVCPLMAVYLGVFHEQIVSKQCLSTLKYLHDSISHFESAFFIILAVCLLPFACRADFARDSAGDGRRASDRAGGARASEVHPMLNNTRFYSVFTNTSFQRMIKSQIPDTKKYATTRFLGTSHFSRLRDSFVVIPHTPMPSINPSIHPSQHPRGRGRL